jgi:hypothetical protein
MRLSGFRLLQYLAIGYRVVAGGTVGCRCAQAITAARTAAGQAHWPAG